ncbi:MAG: methionine--tRNA ligase subunit beta [Planctomycetota bacterium]
MTEQDKGAENTACDGAEEAVPAYDPKDELISIDDVMKLKLRVAEILEAGPHPNADRLLQLRIKVGDREKTLCAGIRKHYEPEQLVGKRIVVVDNLKPATLRGVESQGMLLAASLEDDLTLITTDKSDFGSGADVK